MNPKLEQWFDPKLHKTRFRDVCRRCGRKFHVCSSPQAAHRAAARKGYDFDTGYCRLCLLEVTKAEAREKVA